MGYLMGYGKLTVFGCGKSLFEWVNELFSWPIFHSKLLVYLRVGDWFPIHGGIFKTSIYRWIFYKSSSYWANPMDW